MQKILRLRVQARNAAVRKARKDHLQNLKHEWKSYEQHAVLHERANREAIKTERQNRREDWISGPLAPRRDVGRESGVYGAFDRTRAIGPALPGSLGRAALLGGGGMRRPDDVGGERMKKKNQRNKKLKQVLGEVDGFLGNQGNIVPGDRVCVIRGREGLRGQIGVVKDVQPKSRAIYVEGLNKVDMIVPKASPESKTQPFFNTEHPIPLQDVRLVFRHTVVDEDTGRVIKDRDVLVNLIRGGGPYLEREHGSIIPQHTRYVAGEDIEIPWPEVPVRQHQTFATDTRQRDVENVTFMPSFAPDAAPLQADTVVRELIPETSQLRSLFEEEMVRMKVIADARSRWYESRTLDTPQWEQRQIRLAFGEENSKIASERGISSSTERLIRLAQAEDAARKRGSPHPELDAKAEVAQWEIQSARDALERLKVDRANVDSVREQEAEPELTYEDVAFEKEVVVHDRK